MADDGYTGRFCPLLTHAVLSAHEAKKAPPAPPSLVLGGDNAPLPAPAVQPEFIACQGPACEFFLRGENRCSVSLIPMALAAMLRMQGAPTETNAVPPTETN